METERTSLPAKGRDWDELQSTMREMGGHDVDWRSGKAAVYVFHSGDDVMQVAHDAYGMFIVENGLGPAAFPSLKQMETDVVNIALSLQDAPAGATGSMTSGGSESILLAIKACRDYRAANNPVAGVPEIVAPYSVHPAFNKGAHLMGLKVIRVPCRDDFKADPVAMEAAITPNTIMLVGSAPCFPYGLIDPLDALSDIAVRQNLWLHVDACVGGYLNPFIRAISAHEIETYDFSLPGVSSMSLDLHKYGYAAKGASTVLYRHKAMRDAQVFHFEDWPCGHMYTPTFAGTRPGGAIAAAWAVLNYLGREGYEDRARQIDEARQCLISGCEDLGLVVYGEPKLSIVGFGSENDDILAVGEGLYEQGWFSSRLQDPDGIQYMISPEHHRTMPDYLKTLEANLVDVREGRRTRQQGKISYS